MSKFYFEPPPPDPNIRLRALSLGAGVQSTTLALMAAHGEIGPMPDVAIFADTGAEPAAVYEHLDWLRSGNVLPFPVEIVAAGNLRDELLAFSRGEIGAHGRPPMFVKNPDGSRGQIRRQCTGDYKIDPIRRKVREILGLRPRQRGPKHPVVEQWIGISLDEKGRMKLSGDRWCRHRWPLIEKRMTRQGCILWLERNGYPIPPKSACTFCPYMSNAMRRAQRDEDPTSWGDAVRIDRALRTEAASQKFHGQVFVHPSLVPLDEAELDKPDDGQGDLMLDECDGMCGV